MVLGSGSGGNCTYIESGTTRILIDAGFGSRSLTRRFSLRGIPFDRFDAILVTHGHSDHVCGVEGLVRRFKSVALVNEGTRAEVPALTALDRCEIIETGKPFQVGEIRIEAFPVPHDAAEPVGFRLEAAGVKGILATDLGYVPQELIEKASDCDWLVLESNHDVELLKMGPYPWDLKRRVLGDRGHLSNVDLARFLRAHPPRASHLFLAHLSRQNNHPELALDTAVEALASQQAGGNGHRCGVHLTDQFNPSIVITL